MNMTVVLYPEFIVYRDSYLTVAQLTFSQSHIKITDLNTYGDKGTFDYEWGISDLVDIEYRWLHKVILRTILSVSAVADFHFRHGIIYMPLTIWVAFRLKLYRLNFI